MELGSMLAYGVIVDEVELLHAGLVHPFIRKEITGEPR